MHMGKEGMDCEVMTESKRHKGEPIELEDCLQFPNEMVENHGGEEVMKLGVMTGCDSNIPENNTIGGGLKHGNEEGTVSDVGAEPLIGEVVEGFSGEEAGGIKGTR